MYLEQKVNEGPRDRGILSLFGLDLVRPEDNLLNLSRGRNGHADPTVIRLLKPNFDYLI